MILLNAPQLRQSCWIHDLENASVAVLPRYVVGVALRGVVEELLEEVPQQTPICKKFIKQF